MTTDEDGETDDSKTDDGETGHGETGHGETGHGETEDGASQMLGETEDGAGQMLDVTGLRCPLPVIRLAKAARDAPAGTVITLLSTDPAAEPDVAAWCRMRGQNLLDQTWLDPDQPGIPKILRSRIRVS